MWWKNKKKKSFKGGCVKLSQKGFTLIELLVSTSILGIIGLTIVTTFASGFSVFERVQSFGGPQADVLLALEEMEKDLKNTFPLSAVPFQGDAQKITFPAAIETLDTVEGDEVVNNSIGVVSYYIDNATFIENVSKGLLRSQQNYSSALAGAGPQANESDYLAPLENMAFEYYYYDEEAETYGWQASWSGEEETLLSGVKVAMTYKDAANDREIVRVIMIPALQKIIEIEEEEEEEEDDDDEEEGEGS